MTRSNQSRWQPFVAGGVALVALGLVLKIAESVNESDAVVRADRRIVTFAVDVRVPLVGGTY